MTPSPRGGEWLVLYIYSPAHKERGNVELRKDKRIEMQHGHEASDPPATRDEKKGCVPPHKPRGGEEESSWEEDERSPFVPLAHDFPHRDGQQHDPHRGTEGVDAAGPPFPEHSVFYLPDNVRRELGWCFWTPPPDVAIEMPFCG